MLAVNYSNGTSLLTTYLAHWPGFASLSLCCQAEVVLHLRAQQLIGHHGVEPHWATNRRADCWLPHQPGEGDREDRPLQSWDRYVCQELSTSSVWVVVINKDQQVEKCRLWQGGVSKQPELPVLEAVKEKKKWRKTTLSHKYLYFRLLSYAL